MKEFNNIWSSPEPTPLFFRRIKVNLLLCALCFGSTTVSAQVLARPGWAGSGVASEPWWRAAVFYRIDPARFQDSGGSGGGDLAGIAQRLEYLQSLGVDAIVLDGRFDPNGLDDLVRAASRHSLRVFLTITPSMQAGDRQALLATVHGWLSAGIAGVWAAEPNSAGSAGYGSLIAALDGMLRGFPGARVLLADPTPQSGISGSTMARVHRARGSAPFGSGPGGELRTVAALPVQPPSAAALRQTLTAIAGESAPGVAPLLRFAEDPHTGAPDAATDAALLLASRGAALFDFGDEIGLDAFSPIESNRGSSLPVMQWTPANVQQAVPAPVERPTPAPAGGESVYGPYRPYVRPPSPRLTGPPPALPHASIDGNIPPPLPDPDTLPGFTSGVLPAQPIEGAKINAATEDRNPASLLNAYRQLIALHHGNATLRNGAQDVLNRDAQNSVVWVRRTPAGARTVSDVVIAANLGEQPVTLSLDGDLKKMGVRTGPLRALFTFAGQPLTGEDTGSLQLPPHAVFIGEIVSFRR